MQVTLQAMIGATPERAPALLRELVETMRPRRVDDAQAAINGVRSLAFLLEQSPQARAALRRCLLAVLSRSEQVQFFADTGILSNESFFSAVSRRIGDRLLPPAPNPGALRDLFGSVFYRHNDYIWLESVPQDIWFSLGTALHIEEETDVEQIGRVRGQLLDAIEVLSTRIAAIGLEPEITRNQPETRRSVSPFVRQNLEVHAFIEHNLQAMTEKTVPQEDERHILVLLEQCEDVISRVRKYAMRNGVSVSLSYHLLRITQHIERLKALLRLVSVTRTREKSEAILGVSLTLVRAENRKHSLRDVFAENTEMLALQVTEHASHTGGHYIAETRKEWRGMFRSAAGAGVIVGFMALLKLLFAKAHLPLLLEALAFGLNYAFGFMLVHILHFTIATKQPAMTAARIAATLHEGTRSGKLKPDDIDQLSELIVKVFRTQFIAILGNVLVVLPTALLIALGWVWSTGHPVADADKAQHLLHDLNPIQSLALFHAGIAGVCLFLAGLISGYYDNKALYNQIPQRIAALPWLNRLAGEQRARRLGNYLGNNLGALAGNFYFGMMLGTIGTIGVLLGLPIDIRHITFSSAYLSFAAVTFDFALDWHVVAISALGIALIGYINLIVSFGLALWVALRSRKLTLRATRPIVGRLLRRSVRRPQDFLIPPRARVEETKVTELKGENVVEWVQRRRADTGR
ncbi:site-specific recombinase [Silvimonas terrae]|uniref:Site-specific recombinase n=1 Tax=Silvimonas terrae TaxID=300266 RepID=A0A840RL16_9NEIS|nr:site-specific recombinase [Silvimonas terrae]MBB5193160.1 site-specific recombinase [Silvimonas terrae]